MSSTMKRELIVFFFLCMHGGGGGESVLCLIKEKGLEMHNV